MTTETELTSVTDHELTVAFNEVWQEIDRLTHDPADGYQPYGWDWVTFAVIHPEVYQRYRDIKSELRRRGLLEKGK